MTENNMIAVDSKKNFILSDNIKVFPCAGRGRNGLRLFDPEARLNTEYNTTRHVGLNGFTNTFIQEYNEELGIIKFAINGYYFEIDHFKIDLELKAKQGAESLKYAAIKLRDVSIIDTTTEAGSKEDASKKTKMLDSNLDTLNKVLDTEVTSGITRPFIFSGLVFFKEADKDTFNTPDYRIIQLLDGDHINKHVMLPTILQGFGEKSLVLGQETVAKNDNQLTVGKFNDASRDLEDGNLFVVGNGESALKAKNAFTVNKSGNAKVSGMLHCESITETSDRRLKENIEEFKPNTEKSILDLPIYKYTYKDDPSHKSHIGFMAQDVQEVCPEIVVEDHDGYLAIENSKLIYLLIQEIKDLKAKIK